MTMQPWQQHLHHPGCRYLRRGLCAADACTCGVAARPSAASHRHKKNEVFLDVVESVNLLVNSNGTLVLSEVRAHSMQPLTAAAAALNILLRLCSSACLPTPLRHYPVIQATTLPLLCTQVTGCLKMRTYLSGMPECKLGLNDKVWLHAHVWLPGAGAMWMRQLVWHAARSALHSAQFRASGRRTLPHMSPAPCCCCCRRHLHMF